MMLDKRLRITECLSTPRAAVEGTANRSAPPLNTSMPTMLRADYSAGFHNWGGRTT